MIDSVTRVGFILCPCPIYADEIYKSHTWRMSGVSFQYFYDPNPRFPKNRTARRTIITRFVSVDDVTGNMSNARTVSGAPDTVWWLRFSAHCVGRIIWARFGQLTLMSTPFRVLIHNTSSTNTWIAVWWRSWWAGQLMRPVLKLGPLLANVTTISLWSKLEQTGSQLNNLI